MPNIVLFDSLEWFPVAAVIRPPIIFTLPGEGYLGGIGEVVSADLGAGLVSPICIMVWGNEE
jgi:hypothetical protein